MLNENISGYIQVKVLLFSNILSLILKNILEILLTMHSMYQISPQARRQMNLVDLTLVILLTKYIFG